MRSPSACSYIKQQHTKKDPEFQFKADEFDENNVLHNENISWS